MFTGRDWPVNTYQSTGEVFWIKKHYNVDHNPLNIKTDSLKWAEKCNRYDAFHPAKPTAPPVYWYVFTGLDLSDMAAAAAYRGNEAEAAKRIAAVCAHKRPRV